MKVAFRYFRVHQEPVGGGADSNTAFYPIIIKTNDLNARLLYPPGWSFVRRYRLLLRNLPAQHDHRLLVVRESQVT